MGTHREQVQVRPLYDRKPLGSKITCILITRMNSLQHVLVYQVAE